MASSNRRRLRVRWGMPRAEALVMSVVLVSCGPPTLAPARMAPNVYSQVVPTADTRPTQLLVVADTHNSNPMSSHMTWSGSEISDEIVTRVAIRPAQMDAWALKLLGWLLARHRDTPLVLHLGDAANLGCRREVRQFLDLMRMERPGRWFMAPGNHDSLAYGNWAGIGGSVTRRGDWVADCSNEVNPWNDESFNALETKDLLIEDYVAAQGWNLSVDATTSLDRAANNRCNELPVGRDPSGSLRVHACINQPRQGVTNPPVYVSYLLQQVPVEGTRTVMILVDTTEFVEFPHTGHTGGQQGGVRDDQIQIVETWLREIQRSGRTAILAGHFPIEMLDRRSRTKMTALFETYPVIAYLSAHTHDPTNLRMHGFTSEISRGEAVPRVGLPEINVGSLLDWPMTYMTLGLPSAREPGRLFFAVHDVPSELAIGTDACDPRFNYAADYASYLLSKGTVGKLLDKIRGRANTAYAGERRKMYVAASRDLELSPPLTDKAELGEQPTATRDARRDAYETCQVRWASEQESRSKPGLRYFEDPHVVNVGLFPHADQKVTSWYIEFLDPAPGMHTSTCTMADPAAPAP
jgi:hypothetical protein